MHKSFVCVTQIYVPLTDVTDVEHSTNIMTIGELSSHYPYVSSESKNNYKGIHKLLIYLSITCFFFKLSCIALESYNYAGWLYLCACSITGLKLFKDSFTLLASQLIPLNVSMFLLRPTSLPSPINYSIQVQGMVFLILAFLHKLSSPTCQTYSCKAFGHSIASSTLRNYAKWQLMRVFIPGIDEESLAAYNSLKKTATGKSASDEDRSETCIGVVEQILPMALARSYAEHVLPHGLRVSVGLCILPAGKVPLSMHTHFYKATVSTMTEELKIALKERINTSDWLDDYSRQRAIEKVMK